MKESIHKYFQVGLIAFMAYPSALKGDDPNIVESLKKIAYDDYFDAIEISWIKDKDKRAEAKKLLETAHLKVCYGAQPRLLTTGLNANDINEEGRKKAEATLIEAIDEAAYMGAKGITFLAGKYAEKTKELAYSQLLKTTRNLCDYAKTKDMQIVLEVFDYDIAKASLIGPATYAAKFAAEMRSTHNNFGLMIDLSHIPMTYETSKFVVQTLKPYLVHFHIGNTVVDDPSAEGYGDEHQRFGFPNSRNDVPQVIEFLRVLKNEGFFNSEEPYVLSFEVKPWKDEDADAVIANAKRVLNRAWALLED
ncbi:Sugar phosphate isomerase/epimerase [Anaerovirgula multivorans]|uniref:Sugar phosphate isomerase/epimerase n=1 Tax=Anaerovirgula multivorans TaxID=312168 RepID=A0A239BEF6_9FIRM|nr:TIM barrel protein [Anaerovirgula multivorans]SNS06330.1 Sugar phosphate isomerase/epimerase [Anaerovirgula multivorans]